MPRSGSAGACTVDRPTNHMDIASREAIEDSLAEFNGTVLLVSHDRYLLDKVTTRIVTIEGRRFVPFAGSLSEYWAERGRTRPASSPPAAASTMARPGGPVNADVIERRITEQEAEKLRLEKSIGEAFAAGDHQRGKVLATRLEKTARLLNDLYRQWEEMG